MLVGYVAAYIPSVFPADYSSRLWINTGLDFMVLAGLVVLGGDFWDKLRALFVWDARAVFPSPPGSEPRDQNDGPGVPQWCMVTNSCSRNTSYTKSHPESR